ncbi:MAG TPA: MBL fold metallo-hydrolase [Gaiella sp.]|nr:MBL fold metallo-hydrolase [Gaiella sp.]
MNRRWRVTWLGQAGFRVESEGVCFVIDPWASPHELRLIPPPPDALAAEDVDWVLVTHEHLDHLDLPFLPVVLERSPGARVVLPAPVVPLVNGVVPHDRVVAVRPGDILDLDGVEVRVVPAFHGVTTDDPYGDGSGLGEGPRFVGYVLGGAQRIYHAGDTILTDALREALEPLDIAVALLPVNGRDAEREGRGIVGNMDAREAVDLSLSLGVSLLVPYHWDGFAGNTVDPGTVAEVAGGRIAVTVPSQFGAIDVA